MLPLRDNVPTRRFPVVTVALIAVNFFVWFWELSGRGVDYHVVKDGFYIPLHRVNAALRATGDLGPGKRTPNYGAKTC